MSAFVVKLGGAEEPYVSPVLGLGNFDGVHIGHQAILKRVVERALEIKGTPIAFTFDPHPVRVLYPDRTIQLLCTTKEKMDWFEKCGIRARYCVEFTREFSMQSPRDFVKTVLVDRLKVAEVVVGRNYGFGKGREGNASLLREFGTEFGFHVEVVPPVELNHQIVSSSLIRGLLLEGKVGEVIPMLGRPYQIEGTVIAGEGRGERLGFPTANLLPGEKLVPGNGVYAVRAEKKGELLSGAAYIGTQPTFGNSIRQIEVHLFRQQGPLYGEELKVYFQDTIRGERKFSSRIELIDQIRKDILRAKEILCEK